MSVNPQLRAVTDPADHMALTVKDMMTRLEAIERYIGSGAVPLWTGVTFQNGWISFAGQQAVEFRKQGDRVFIRGQMASGTISTVAFTLPVGYRPPAEIDFIVIAGASTFGNIAVRANGDVVPQVGNTTYFAVNLDFSTTP